MNKLDTTIAAIYRTAGLGTQGFRGRAMSQLAEVIQFDGALWGTGRLDSDSFHSVDVFGVEDSYPAALAKTKQYNPIYDAFKRSPGKAVNMSDVVKDGVFYSSDLYNNFFSIFGVERIIGVIFADEKTGIFNLISLYRFQRDTPFSSMDQSMLTDLVFHLVSGASHAYFLHLNHKNDPIRNAAYAICDIHGLYFEAQPKFIEMIEQYFPASPHGKLPFEPEGCDTTLADGQLKLIKEPVDDMLCIGIWQSRPLDLLTAREQEVVEVISHGLSFKEAARKINMAPSTVSNHLYNVYRKLNISSRSELATLSNPLTNYDNK